MSSAKKTRPSLKTAKQGEIKEKALPQRTLSPAEYLPKQAPWVHGEFDFNDLFIFELANNHQGDVAHGTRIIKEVAGRAADAGVRAAIKFQFRELDSFIHPDHKQASTNKHIPRFLSTKLMERNNAELTALAEEHGLLTMATPFDEPSVDLLERLGIQIIKVASCSATDWPLLERIAEAGKPVICSTAGVAIEDVDRIVSFFHHRGVQFALMHCVALYPTPLEKMNLNRIEHFVKRYPGITIGFSTHEAPEVTSTIGIAYAKGARIFEKHIGLPTKEYSVNRYSATPEQIAAWLGAWKEAVAMTSSEGTETAGKEETESLRSLMRGVFAKRALRAGAVLSSKDVYFAMPAADTQLVSGEWKDSMVADRAYKINEAIGSEAKVSYKTPKREIVAAYTRAIRSMLKESGVELGLAPEVDLSHHYGLDRFREYGTTIIDCINREYCKKVLIQLPGQYHPMHYHRRKEEAFQIVQGVLIVELEGKEKILYPGDVLVVPRGSWHRFWSETGAIFEEISTTHFNDDSFYADKAISKLPRDVRKTKLVNWGRHQFDQE
ncbi:MAG: N-acetylneuraminate synthase family protein [Candidatus Pacebacteria bacterium]|nr:N-acetylneuraminate synthase family protein [Candidatus Paceibacterota bacterium]